MAQKQMRRSTLGFALIVFTTSAVAEVPLLINYRGYVSGQVQGAVTVDLEFSLYDSDIPGATPIWTELQSVQLLDGNFAVLLGSQEALSPDLFSGSPRYLGVSLNGGEVIPPQQVVSVPYAMQAGNVYSAPDGRVGIGTTQPGAELDVAGGVAAESLASSGDAAIGGALAVTGGTTTGELTSNGNATVNGALDVAGGVAAESLTSSADAAIGGSLAVTGGTTTGGLTSNGDAAVDGALVVTGETSTGTLAVNDSLSVTHQTSTGTLAATGDAAISGGLTALGNVGIGTATPEARLHVAGDALVDGTLTVNGALSLGGSAQHVLFPPGAIIAYYGTVPPEGWLLCDGSPIPASPECDCLRAMVGPNTPDLRGRMILMADPSGTVLPNTTPAFGVADGEEEHALTIQEIPAHNHNFSLDRKGWPDGGYDGGGSYKYWNEYFYPYRTPPVNTSMTGGNEPHNNMPPYMALNWIIKY